MNLGTSSRRAVFAAAAAVAGLAVTVQAGGPAAAAAAVRNDMISVSSAGVQGDGSTFAGDISADGRYAVFGSSSTNLVPGDTNDTDDVFLRDRLTGVTTRISLSATGEQGNGSSGDAHISADGRYITFVSYASNLVPGVRADTGDQIYLYDRVAGTLKLISATPGGTSDNADNYNPTITADGSRIAFMTYADDLIPGVSGSNVVVWDRTTGDLTTASVAPDGTAPTDGGFGPSISDNGRYVAFNSFSTALLPGNTGGVAAVYVRDLVAGTTVRASVSDNGQVIADSRGGEVSDNGLVVFWTDNNGLVPGDTNGGPDVFVRDLAAGTTRLVSTNTAGVQGNDSSDGPDISADGRYVVFNSFATNMVAGDTNNDLDVFRKDLQTGTTTLVSRAVGGAVTGDHGSFNPVITPNGKLVLFGSDADNMVTGDTNDQTDLFVTRIVG